MVFYDDDADVQLVTLEDAFKLLLALGVHWHQYRGRGAGLHGGAAKDGASGLRIRARTIARAHPGRHGERDSVAAPGPPPMGRRSERTTPEARGSEWQPRNLVWDREAVDRTTRREQQ